MKHMIKMKGSTLVMLLELAGLGGIIIWLTGQWHDQGRLTSDDWKVAALAAIITGVILFIAGTYIGRKLAVK
jgi:hypothetical protein